MDVPQASGITHYDSLLKEKLASEDARKSSLEQRALAVITTSGALVTLLFGLAALSTKREATFDLSDFAETALAVALGLFIGAAVLALRTNTPVDYQEVEADAIQGRINETPPCTSDEAIKDIALTRVDELRSAREKNGEKARQLQWAVGLEVAAVLAVAVAIWDVLAPF